MVSCNKSEPYSKAFQISNRAQAIGGPAALAELGDYILENDKIRIAISGAGNSVGPGVFGGSLLDADIHRPQAEYRGGKGKDQFAELFPLGNLSTPAICVGDSAKDDEFCKRGSSAVSPKVSVLCNGRSLCELDLSDEKNADYGFEGALPSSAAAILRVEGQAGNYLEALGLLGIIGVKMNFSFRNDFILEPGESVVRIRTMLTETRVSGRARNPNGEIVSLPSLSEPTAIFGVLLGSDMYETHLDGLTPGIAGGDFLFFGNRLNIFAPGLGFDIYKDIRDKFSVGRDPLNEPIAAQFISGVGENVSYAIASADATGKYLLPLYSGAVTAGFTHGAHCYSGECPGTEEECKNVTDCSKVRSFVFERYFAIGDGDVASVTGHLFKKWELATGKLHGHVYDQRTSQPVSQAEVFVYPIPENMNECHPQGDSSEEYSYGPQGFIRECLEKRSYMGAVNHLRTDRRAEDLSEGAFEGRLPIGQYYLLSKKPNRPASQVELVEIQEGQTSKINLRLPPPAKVQFEILDENNQRIPAKMTVGQCFPNCSGRLEGDCQDDADCLIGSCVEVRGQTERQCLIDNCGDGQVCDLNQNRCVSLTPCSLDSDCALMEVCQEGSCHCLPTFQRHLSLTESDYPKGVAHYVYTADGVGEFEIEPGDYDIWASRGFEYSVDKTRVSLRAGETRLITARLVREVDTAGWVSGDFHVHGQNSFDAVVKHADRVTSYAGEGVEMLSSSDHDYLTDFQPYVYSLGLEKWLATQVGTETSTVELGHFLGFPLRYQEWQDGERVPEQGAIDWTGKVPDQMFDEMRDLGLYDPEETVVVVAHPRDSFFGYFDQYGLDAFNPLNLVGSLFEWLPGLGHANPLANPDNFSGRFDALELLNGKRYELIRTPAVGEIRDYNQARQIIESSVYQGSSPEEVERQIIALDHEYIKDILKRTPGEQEAIWNADGTLECEVEETPRMMPCASYNGVVDDWFRLLDYGVVRTGMGNSDSHTLTGPEAGLPRNFIRSSAEVAPAIDKLELARSIRQGRVVASYGPFVEMWLGDKEIGETFTPQIGSDSIKMRIRVQSPSWFDIDRVEVYRSGSLIHVYSSSGDEIDASSSVDTSGLQLPNPRTVNLDSVVEEPLPTQDAWYVVIVMGLDGRDLTPVYSELPYADLQVGDILARSFSNVPLPLDMAGSMIPRVYRVYPYAISNPIFVDVDGNGKYDAPHESPGWAEGVAPLSSMQTPLALSGVEREAEEQSQKRLRRIRYFQGLLYQAMQRGRAR
jgi:hypothetical protein